MALKPHRHELTEGLAELTELSDGTPVKSRAFDTRARLDSDHGPVVNAPLRVPAPPAYALGREASPEERAEAPPLKRRRGGQKGAKLGTYHGLKSAGVRDRLTDMPSLPKFAEGEPPPRPAHPDDPGPALTPQDQDIIDAWAESAPTASAKFIALRKAGWSGVDVLEPAVRDAFYATYVTNRILTVAAMRGVSEAELSRRLGYKLQSTRWSGKPLRLPTIFSAARLLGVPVYTFFVGMDEPTVSLPHDVIAGFMNSYMRRERGDSLKRLRHYLVLRFGEGPVATIEQRLDAFDKLAQMKWAVANAGAQRGRAPVPSDMLGPIKFSTLPRLRSKLPKGALLVRPIDPYAHRGEVVFAPMPVPFADPPREEDLTRKERMLLQRTERNEQHPGGPDAGVHQTHPVSRAFTQYVTRRRRQRMEDG